MDHEMTMKSLVSLTPNTHKTWARHNCPLITTCASALNQNESRRRIEGIAGRKGEDPEGVVLGAVEES